MHPYTPDTTVSLERTKEELARFIKDSVPEVMSLRGHWGTGKTWTWNNVLENNKDNAGLSKYSYVSLFGIDSIHDLETAIFRSTINRNTIGTKPTLQTLLANTQNILGISKYLGIIKLPIDLDKCANIINSLSNLAIKDTLICIDDVERIGEKLSLQDILGLVTQLKDQRNCKIVLIFNDEKLNQNEKNFRTFREKVIDTDIKLFIAPSECVKIVFGNCEALEQKLIECCNHFSIDNIRIIQRIKKLYDSLKTLLNRFDSEVLEQSVCTLIPLAWAYYSQDKEVYEYIKNSENKKSIHTSDSLTDKNIEHLLNSHTYRTSYELKPDLLFAVEHGFFIEDRLIKSAENVEKRIIFDRKQDAFAKAWEPYHASFNDNEDEVVESLHKYYTSNKNTLPLRYLDQILGFFREINQEEAANELMDDFFEAKSHDEIANEIDNGFENFGLTDKRLIDKVKLLKSESRKNNLSIESILIKIAEKKPYDTYDLDFLAERTVEDYYNLFKNLKDVNIRNKICREAVKFGYIRTDDDRYKTIYHSVQKALSKIAHESVLNKARVSVIDTACIT